MGIQSVWLWRRREAEQREGYKENLKNFFKMCKMVHLVQEGPLTSAKLVKKLLRRFLKFISDFVFLPKTTFTRPCPPWLTRRSRARARRARTSWRQRRWLINFLNILQLFSFTDGSCEECSRGDRSQWFGFHLLGGIQAAGDEITWLQRQLPYQTLSVMRLDYFFLWYKISICK